jgi:hypothetical protein
MKLISKTSNKKKLMMNLGHIVQFTLMEKNELIKFTQN